MIDAEAPAAGTSRAGPGPARDPRGYTPVEDDPARPRLFFALPIPDPARGQVGELMDRVQQSVADGRAKIRWVRVEGLHLTLRFLGQTAVDRIPGLEAAADRLAAATAPFGVTIARAGAFPNPARPRTLWLGIEDGAETLAGLADELGRSIEPDTGPLGTRPFAPHLTIARTDGLRDGAVAARTLRDEAERLEARFVADRVILFRSHLGRGPARYEPIHEAVLTG
jgi:2'-5' RNA ligase